jgi:hypothetical protein
VQAQQTGYSNYLKTLGKAPTVGGRTEAIGQSGMHSALASESVIPAMNLAQADATRTSLFAAALDKVLTINANTLVKHVVSGGAAGS